MNIPSKANTSKADASKADAPSGAFKTDVSTKINAAYYAMRIISHRIDTSQLPVNPAGGWQSQEFTPDERGLTLELLAGIQRQTKTYIRDITDSTAHELLFFFADKVEELANTELAAARYNVSKAQLILEKLRQTDTDLLEADVPDTPRAGAPEHETTGPEVDDSRARQYEPVQIWGEDVAGIWESVFAETLGIDFLDVHSAIGKWQHFPTSQILHHGQPCCRLAREWIFSTDYLQLMGESPLTGPRWLLQRYKWGPSCWPISWCQVVRQDTLDSGALAALAIEIFAARGIHSFPVQLIQQFDESATRQYLERWEGDEASTHWIMGELIYHEACAVIVRENEIRIWHPSAGSWINPKQFGGYGAVIALRLISHVYSPTIFYWGTHNIIPNQWQKIERARVDF